MLRFDAKYTVRQSGDRNVPVSLPSGKLSAVETVGGLPIVPWPMSEPRIVRYELSAAHGMNHLSTPVVLTPGTRSGGPHVPPTAWRDTRQMSRLPRPPARADAKYSVRSSDEKRGVSSLTPVTLNGSRAGR